MRVTVLILGAVVSWPAGAIAQEDPLNRIDQRLDRIEQRLDDASTAGPAADCPATGNSAASDQRWRFKYHGGAWWYWLPSERWVWWSNGAWVDYEPATYSPLRGVYRYPVYGYGLYYGGYHGYGDHYGYGGHGYGGHGYGGHYGYGGHGYGGHYGYGGHGYGGHGGYH